jgi:hypothetical protein
MMEYSFGEDVGSYLIRGSMYLEFGPDLYHIIIDISANRFRKIEHKAAYFWLPFRTHYFVIKA